MDSFRRCCVDVLAFRYNMRLTCQPIHDREMHFNSSPLMHRSFLLNHPCIWWACVWFVCLMDGEGSTPSIVFFNCSGWVRCNSEPNCRHGLVLSRPLKFTYNEIHCNCKHLEHLATGRNCGRNYKKQLMGQ